MASVTHVVAAEHTARAVGSGDLDVLGTPVVLAWCEEATCAELALEGDQTSVGTRVDLEHVAASAVGSTISATAEIIARDGRLVTFRVTAVDQAGAVVASGEIRRVIVDRDRFLARVGRPDA